ncbi:hypothetical protein LOTGIDRAFT_156126 [Lottia gigantea]|uniref:ShKT domain-containing protein n=1 Tax=Lottia gigantea TaxID=225164 RepID=V4BBG9_LOTGI|nr:hypothetical protein LOTGIDRAFT_156126 [Lottia gigantea]ESP04886.1 hypothetical protein LOTGIDRAFT_156126 [Lottia gigantea]
MDTWKFCCVLILLSATDINADHPFVTDCRDHDQIDCYKIRGTAECREEWVYEFCPLSCGICGLLKPDSNKCVDHNRECDSIQSSDHKSCKDIVIKEVCPKSCGVCGHHKHTHPPHLLKTTAKATSKPPTTTPIPTSDKTTINPSTATDINAEHPFVTDCKDHDQVDCYKIRGTAECREEWVYEFCPLSCGICGLLKPDSNKCVDHNRECDSIQSSDHKSCKDIVIKEVCPKSCGVCGHHKHTHPPHLLKTTAKATSKPPTTTPIPTSDKTTINPSTARCQVCNDPFCLIGFANINYCRQDTPYCLSSVSFDANGKRRLDKRCASVQECDEKWINRSAKMTKCLELDKMTTYQTNLECDFCCVTDNCNAHTLPNKDTLYTKQ